MDDIAASVRRVSARIDAHNAGRDPEAVTAERVAKLAEETGEAVAAWLGVTGQNPRKGRTHTIHELQREVLDVAVTALAVWEHLDSNRGQVMDALREHVRRLDGRGLETEHGTRDELERRIMFSGDGCQGRDWDPEPAQAVAALRAGAASVQVGSRRYVVTDSE